MRAIGAVIGVLVLLGLAVFVVVLVIVGGLMLADSPELWSAERAARACEQREVRPVRSARGTTWTMAEVCVGDPGPR